MWQGGYIPLATLSNLEIPHYSSLSKLFLKLIPHEFANDAEFSGGHIEITFANGRSASTKNLR